MGAEGLAELVAEIQKARDSIEQGDVRTNARIDTIEKSLNALLVKVNRPGAEFAANDNNSDFVRKDAIGLCYVRHKL
jgi:hypothetical protein